MENTRYISGAAAAMDGSTQHHAQHITAVWQHHGFATALAWHVCQCFLVLFPLLQCGVQQALDLFF